MRKNMEWSAVSSTQISEMTAISQLKTVTQLILTAGQGIPHQSSEAASCFSRHTREIQPLRDTLLKRTLLVLVLRRPLLKFPPSQYLGKTPYHFFKRSMAMV